jgi:hypothetical protein
MPSAITRKGCREKEAIGTQPTLRAHYGSKSQPIMLPFPFETLDPKLSGTPKLLVQEDKDIRNIYPARTKWRRMNSRNIGG